MQIVPTLALPNQQITVTLANQNCRIDLYQMSYGLFCDLYVSNRIFAPGTLIIGGVICQAKNRIVRDAYLGFIGDLIFIDNDEGPNMPAEDPFFSGLGTRFSLAYLSVADLNGQG